MYFCYNLEKEEGSLKTELKNCLSLEANYSISSKQYVENGIHMKVLSKGKPNENCVLDNDITLEDAYIYLTNS